MIDEHESYVIQIITTVRFSKDSNLHNISSEYVRIISDSWALEVIISDSKIL